MSADTILRSDYSGLTAWLAAADGKAAKAAPATGEGPQPMGQDAAGGAADAGDFRAAVRERVLTKIMDELIFHARAEVGVGVLVAAAARVVRYMITVCSTRTRPKNSLCGLPTIEPHMAGRDAGAQAWACLLSPGALRRVHSAAVADEPHRRPPRAAAAPDRHPGPLSRCCLQMCASTGPPQSLAASPDSVASPVGCMQSSAAPAALCAPAGVRS